HYPLEVETEVAIAEQESRPMDVPGVRVEMPAFMAEVVATVSHLARSSPHVNQRSGVSVRLTVANDEVLMANAVRRSLHLGDDEVVPRVSDLDALIASTAGKIELDTVEEGRDEIIVENLVKAALLTVWRAHCNIGSLVDVVTAFDDGRVVHAGEDIATAHYVELVSQVPALRAHVSELIGDDESPGMVASAVEFLLEGLHLSKRLNKDAAGTRATYRSRG
ncbi:MAG: magnesium chelatase, partial [Acidimicrobiia bacterium]